MTAVADPWQSICAARLPAAGIAALAAVRHLADVTVQFEGETAWVHWPAGRLDVVRCLLPVVGVQFYRQEANEWFHFTHRLPTAERPPITERVPVASVLFPDRIEPQSPTDTVLSPVAIRIVRGGPPQSATAMMCATRELAIWADTATTRELAHVTAAIHDDRILLRGEQLPSVPTAIRFWGETLFVPMGFRIEPPLPPTLIREAVGATSEEFVFLLEDAVEIVPKLEFAPLSRARLRLAIAPLTPAVP